MKIISFFLCALFICASGNTKASFSKDSGIYYLEVDRIFDRDEQKNLERTNFKDFGNLTRIPVVLKAKETYKFGNHVLEKDDEITVCYHFIKNNIIKNLDKETLMQVPKEFVAIKEWQAVLNFANTLLNDPKFSTDSSVDSVIIFMDNRERDHHKPEYQENWVEKLFWRKTS